MVCVGIIIEEDDLRTPQGEAVDATTFGWSWRITYWGAQCTADCGDACPVVALLNSYRRKMLPVSGSPCMSTFGHHKIHSTCVVKS